MRANLRWVVAAACVVILLDPFVWAGPGRNESKEQKLTAKIEREKNPGKKARLQLRLAKLKLKEANAAYLDRHFQDTVRCGAGLPENDRFRAMKSQGP